MGNQSSNSDCGYVRGQSRGSGSRPGVAKDQLIFIIICSVALAVAAVTMVHFFTVGKSKVRPRQWQCLNSDCNNEFTVKKAMSNSVECTKCGGQAARLIYRNCPACGEKVLTSRIRVADQASGAGPDGSPLGFSMTPPMYHQYWVKQEDGSYTWTTSWLLAGSPQSIQIDQNLICTECGQSLSLMLRP